MQHQECHHLNSPTAVSRSIDQKGGNGFMANIGISIRFCGCWYRERRCFTLLDGAAAALSRPTELSVNPCLWGSEPDTAVLTVTPGVP